MAARFDLIIRNGTVIDGTGNKGFEGDVAIRDGRIAAVGNIAGTGHEELDAKGRIVTPGFVESRHVVGLVLDRKGDLACGRRAAECDRSACWAVAGGVALGGKDALLDRTPRIAA